MDRITAKGFVVAPPTRRDHAIGGMSRSHVQMEREDAKREQEQVRYSVKLSTVCACGEPVVTLWPVVVNGRRLGVLGTCKGHRPGDGLTLEDC